MALLCYVYYFQPLGIKCVSVATLSQNVFIVKMEHIFGEWAEGEQKPADRMMQNKESVWQKVISSRSGCTEKKKVRRWKKTMKDGDVVKGSL